jgi:hypothetical protein
MVTTKTEYKTSAICIIIKMAIFKDLKNIMVLHFIDNSFVLESLEN